MWTKRHSENKADFRKDIPEYSDEQIIEVLKLRDHYQPEAAKLAIEEALRRGIIHSEQDLFSDAFRCEEIKYALFPPIKKETNRIKIRKSIARNLVLASIIPVVYGLFELKAQNKPEGVLSVLFGVVWLFCSAHLLKRFQLFFARCLMIANVLATCFIYYKLIFLDSWSFINIFLATVIPGLIIYALLFLIRISRK
ncbi:MAG TPA: hypothetical protein VEP89_18375 [Draconibacterium sp.]|nr:hypothetical protein [Draconibacterium sp.]